MTIRRKGRRCPMRTLRDPSTCKGAAMTLFNDVSQEKASANREKLPRSMSRSALLEEHIPAFNSKDTMHSRNKSSSLVFLEVTHPTLPRGKDAQRVIRSHVTKLQHAKRKQRYRTDYPVVAAEHREDSTSWNTDRGALVNDQAPSKSLSEPASPDDEASEQPALPFFNSSHPSQIKNSNVRRLVRSHVTKWQHRRRRKEAADAADSAQSPIQTEQTTPVHAFWLPPLPASSSEKLISKGAAAIRNVILDDSSNTVATAITRLGLDLKSIMVRPKVAFQA